MAENKVPVSMRMRPELRERVKAHAASRGISESAAYDELIAQALDVPPEPPEPVRHGRVEEVQAPSLDAGKAKMAALLAKPNVPAIPVTRVTEERQHAHGGGIVSAIKGLPIGFTEYEGSFQKGDKAVRRARPLST